MLRDFLPIDVALNTTSVRRDTLRVARRLEAECVLTGEPAKRFGFVQSHDPKARRYFAGVLNRQGLRHNQELVFLSDSEESLRQLQCYLRPHSQHLLDWFHLTMQLTNLSQSLRGLTRLDTKQAADLQEALEHTKWNLWHGKAKRALEWLRQIEWRIWHFASRYAKFLALARAVDGLHHYLWRNGDLIPKCAQRHRDGQAISTAFVESLVNSLLSRRFSKSGPCSGRLKAPTSCSRSEPGPSTATSRPHSASGIPRCHSRTSRPPTTCSRPDRPRLSCARPCRSIVAPRALPAWTVQRALDRSRPRLYSKALRELGKRPAAAVTASVTSGARREPPTQRACC